MGVRVWVVSGLLVAAVVAGILAFRGSSPGGDPKPRARPAAPSPLTEQEIRTYIAVWPQINRVLAATLRPMSERHQGGPDQEELGRRVRAAIDAILLDDHLSREAWAKLRRRVEHAVDVVRWRAESERRNADLETQIQQKEDLLELADGTAQAMLEADIAALKEKQVAKGPPLLRRDVDLIKSFWKDLDRITPARGSPPRKK